MMAFDDWKTTDPADAELGPAPARWDTASALEEPAPIDWEGHARLLAARVRTLTLYFAIRRKGGGVSEECLRELEGVESMVGLDSQELAKKIVLGPL